MKLKLVQLVSFLGCAVMLQSVTAVAEVYDSRLSLSAGVDVSSGTYGGDEEIEDTYVPITATADVDKGLGTGESDLSVSTVSSVGYKFRGDPREL